MNKNKKIICLYQKYFNVLTIVFTIKQLQFISEQRPPLKSRRDLMDDCRNFNK